MKFVNLDESEIIEQPLEKVIARPDYSPIEFGYDNLCSLDSVSVDGIHPSGGDSDLILPPSVNKINSCFKSEYFKISNLFSEIQTYEQKQEALKNLGLLGAINNSTYIHDLGRFDKQVDAEEEAVKVANDSNIIIMLYHIGSQNGIILQQVGDIITKQILLWDNTIFQRHINFSDSSKTQVSSTSYWWKLGATHISYDPDTRKFHLQDMNYNNLNPTVDSKVPLASSTLDGFMSKELAQKLGTTLVKNDITNNLTTSSSTKVLSAQMGKTLKTEIDKLQLLAVKDLGTDLQPHIATENIITYVKDNNIKETVLFKYIDTDGSSTLGVCISRINDIGWIIYLVARKGIERLVFNSNGVREEWNEYGGVLRHNLDSVADEQLECLSVKGVKSLLSTKLDALSLGDGITMMNNTVSTLIGNGLTYNGREIVIDHDLTLKTNNGKLGVNAGDGLYVNPDNELGINVGKGLTINHTDSTVEVAKEVLEEIDSKAPLEGYAPNLKVRFSDGLVGRIETIPHEIGKISPTAGISVDDNSATIERIKGESVVWNQLEPNYDLSNNALSAACKNTTTINGIVSIEGVNSYTAYIYASQDKIKIYQGHKYLLSVEVRSAEYVPTQMAVYDLTNKKSLVVAVLTRPRSNKWEKISNITTATTNGIGSFLIYPAYNSSIANTLTDWQGRNFIVQDLTLMFGAGNEPTTIEEFEARKPLGVTNEYNEGTIVSFQGGDVKSVGFNAWDEEVHLGYYVDKTGLHANIKDRLCSKNPIKIIPNSTYYKNIKEFGVFYDSNMNYIGSHNSVNIFTTPPNAAYYQFNIPKEYGTTYKNDICIHLVHSGYRNGEYEPYVDDIHPLPDIKSIKDSSGDTLFPYGLLSAGSVYDEITATKAIKKIGVVDMGSFNWRTMTHSDGQVYFYTSDNKVNEIKQATKANIPANLMCIPYQPGPSTGLIASGDKRIARNAQTPGSLYVYDTSYTDETTFKTVMQGVLLYYELAEPIEVDLEEPLNMTYEAWDFGTEELVVSEPSTSLKGEIIYHFNAVDRIRENSRAIEILKEHVEERKDDGIELLTNGNLKLTLKGLTKEFMPATPSGDPMHYAYETAGAVYNATDNYILKDAPWKDMVDTIEDKAKWGFDVVDASQVKQMTINGTTYNYVQTTRQSPEGTTEPRYFLVGQASDGTWVEDETKVLHLPGHWYLVGLGDITNKEMRRILDEKEVKYRWDKTRGGQSTKARTIIPVNNVANIDMIPTLNTPYGINAESICVTHISEFKASEHARALSVYTVGVGNKTRYIQTCKNKAGTPFSEAHVVSFIDLTQNCDINNVPHLSKPSILYTINKAIPTTAITITLHATRYVQLAEDADIVAALQAKNTALEGTGGSVSLVSA